MKKHLFLGLLAASLSLVACGKDNEPSGPVDPLTPEQRQNATATNGIIYDTVKDAYGEEAAEANKEYILARSEHAASKGVEASKIAAYLEAGAKLDSEQPMAILNFVLNIHKDEGLDDAAYFGVALGQSMLKVGSAAGKEEDRPYFTAALADVEPEADHIAENAYSALNNVCVGVESAIALIPTEDASSMSNVATLAMLIMGKQVINGEVLKGALHEVRLVLDEFLKVEASVTYFGDFAIKVASDLLAVTPDVPEGLAPFIAELKVDEYVAALFAEAKSLVEGIDSLPEAYYTHLGAITIPEESYAYALLGALEALAPETEELTPEEIAALPKQLVGALGAIYASVADFIPEDVAKVIAAVLADENLETLFTAVVQLGVDAEKADFSFATVEKVSHIIGVYFGSIDVKSVETAFVEHDFEDLKNSTNIPEDVKKLLPLDYLEVCIENHQSISEPIELSDYTYAIGGSAGTINARSVSYEISYQYVEEGEDVFSASVKYETITIKYSSLQEIAEFIDEFLVALADKDGSDVIVEDVLDILVPLNALLKTYVTPLIEKNKDYTDVVTALGYLDLVAYYVAEEPAFGAGIKAVVNDLFVFIEDFFSSFLADGETPAAVDFSTFFVLLTQVSLEDAVGFLMGKIPAENLQSVMPLAADVYNLLAATGLGLEAMLVSIVCAATEGAVKPADIKTAEDFANLVYMVVASMFAAK